MDKQKLFKWLKISVGLTIVLIVIPSTILFSLAYSKATNIYVENLFCSETEYDVTIDSNKRIHLVYVQDTDLIYEKRSLNNKVLDKRIVTTTNQKITNVFISYFDEVEILYEKDGYIHYYSFATKLKFGLGSDAQLIQLGGESTLVYTRDNNLYISPVEKMELLVAQAIMGYSVTSYNDSYYFTFEKLNNICLKKVTDGVWYEEQIVAPGANPYYVRNNNMSYIFHLNQYRHLRVYYGVNDYFVMQETITEEEISDLIIKEQVISFVANGIVYCLKLTNEGCSPIIEVGSGETVKVALSIDTAVFYAREGYIYEQFVSIIEKDFQLLPTLEIAISDQTYFWQAKEYINAYYGDVEIETVTIHWFEENPFETALLLAVFGILTIFGLSAWLIYKPPKKNKNKNSQEVKR